MKRCYRKWSPYLRSGVMRFEFVGEYSYCVEVFFPEGGGSVFFWNLYVTYQTAWCQSVRLQQEVLGKMNLVFLEEISIYGGCCECVLWPPKSLLAWLGWWWEFTFFHREPRLGWSVFCSWCQWTCSFNMWPARVHRIHKVHVGLLEMRKG
jgi:hypothetical protein